jgi:uncharacterized protein YcnI
MKRRTVSIKTLLAAALVALVAPAAALAHAEMSPTVGLKGRLALYTLAVPTEKANAQTTQIEFTPPSGFNIDSFVPTPGWKRTVQQTGSGENAVITKVTWAGGSVPTNEDSAFAFLAAPISAKTYTFGVRQTYSDGSVVDWNGPESSDTPSPTITIRSSLGGGGSSTLTIVALVVGAVGVLLGGLALVACGRRSLA